MSTEFLHNVEVTCRQSLRTHFPEVNFWVIATDDVFNLAQYTILNNRSMERDNCVLRLIEQLKVSASLKKILFGHCLSILIYLC